MMKNDENFVSRLSQSVTIKMIVTQLISLSFLPLFTVSPHLTAKGYNVVTFTYYDFTQK
jgi:long-subunit acyl-CoA synthetase (AMP-forming)